MYDNERYKIKKALVNEILVLEKSSLEYNKVLSKRTLQTILRHDETLYTGSDQMKQQQNMISSLVDKLIETKLDFNKMHITDLNTSLSKVLEVGFSYCNDLRNI